jgi:hypothetical protein
VDRKLLARLIRLVDQTRAKVDLSSTWRYDPAGLFSAKHWGIPFMDVTPDMPKRPRRDEILAWLKQHPKVTRFAIIDDEDDELDVLPLFQPSASAGITREIAKGVADFLEAKTSKDMRSSALHRAYQGLRAAALGHQG